MKNYNKKICLFLLLAILSVGNNVLAQDITVSDTRVQSSEITEKIKANKETLFKAQDAINKKDYNSAINYLTGYINSKSGKYEAYKLRGDAYYAIRRYDLAQMDYQSAIDLKISDDKLSTGTKYVSAIVLGADKNEQLQNPELGNLYAHLMYAQKALNNPSYALSYDNAVKYNSHIYMPQPNKSEINKINCPQKYGKPLNPTGIDETIYSAIEDIQKENFHAAIFKIQNVINEYPNYYLGYYLMGVALTGEEKDDEAISAFNKAVSLNPFDFESYASLGQIYFDKAETNFTELDIQKSNSYFDKAINLNRNCPTYYLYRGLNELNAGNYKSAIYEFDKALKINENDYNSIYYKLIAQYILGDYNSVIAGADKLVYKHVSNVNSVLYLRALAYSKLGNNEKALTDLSSIESNISDIFNSDIKTNSKKDVSLESYVNYLRNNIEYKKGISGKTNNGNSNPIINRLVNAQKSLAPYKNILESKNLSSEDYKKLENFYSTSLPKLLETGAFITYEDIDTQYDFIRTTFSDLGITFIQKSPDNYVMTTIKDYPYKRFPQITEQVGDGITKEYFDNDIQNIDLQHDENINTNSFNQFSNVTLAPGETSLAQMLASNLLASRPLTSGATMVNPKPVLEGYNSDIANGVFVPELPDGEIANPAPVATSAEPYLQTEKQLINDNNLQKMKEIITEENVYSGITNSIPQRTPSDEVEISAKQNIAQFTDNLEPAVKKNQNSAQNVVLERNKTVANNFNINKPVYNGLSKDAKMPEIYNWNDVVELDLSSNSNNNGLFQTDRLGYGIVGQASSSGFTDAPKMDLTQKVDNNVEYPITITDNNIDENINIPEITLPQMNNLIQENITTAVPAYQPDGDIPQLRLASVKQEQKKKETTSYEEIASNLTRTKDGYTLLDEYDRLLKEQKKQAKIKAKQEKQLAKDSAKQQKQKLKEELNSLKAEQKIKSAQDKLIDAQEKIKLNEEKNLAKAEAKQLKAEDKAKAKAEKLKLKQETKESNTTKSQTLKARIEERTIKKQLKEERKEAIAKQKAKLANEKAIAKQLKEEQKKQKSQLLVQNESSEDGFMSKLKNIFKTKTNNIVSEEQKLKSKSEKENLKKERAEAKAQQKIKLAEQKAIKQAQKEQKAAEKAKQKAENKALKLVNKEQKQAEKNINLKTTGKKNSFKDSLSKLKFWEKTSNNTTTTKKRTILKQSKPKQDGTPSLRM